MDAHSELDGGVTYWNGSTPSVEAPALSNEDLYKKAIDGAIIATGYADQLLNKAIRQHGRDKEIGTRALVLSPLYHRVDRGTSDETRTAAAAPRRGTWEDKRGVHV